MASNRAFEFSIEHVFLPPKLPQSGDEPESAFHESQLLETVAEALKQFGELSEPSLKCAIDHANLAIRKLIDLKDSEGFVIETKLCDFLVELTQHGKSIFN